MKKIVINGKEITTNYGESGADTIVAGNYLPNYYMCLKDFGESDEEFFERLCKYYSRIRFAMVTTAIRGCYKTIAYCR